MLDFILVRRINSIVLKKGKATSTLRGVVTYYVLFFSYVRSRWGNGPAAAQAGRALRTQLGCATAVVPQTDGVI
jgi:hypothetical protein